MNLTRLLNEIDLLYRSQGRFDVPVKETVAALVVHYLGSLYIEEPPIPQWQSYTWPKGRGGK